MKAITIVEATPRNRLELRDVPDPVPGPTEMLVRVKAAGVNRADLARALSHSANPPPGWIPIGGLEMAGEVAHLGSEVRDFRVGDRVMSNAPASYAEYVKVDARVAMRVPEAYSWEQAAATPVAYLTAHDATITNGRMKAGDSVLVQAASSGAGIAAVQLAKLLGGKPVMGTSGSDEKLERLADLGLDVGINHRQNDFADAVLAATGGRGADVIVDHVSAGVLAGNLKCAAVLGRIVDVGRLGGRHDQIDLDLLALKRISLIGVTFRTRSIAEVQEIIRRFEADCREHLESGRLKFPIDRTFGLFEAAEAQAYMEENRHFGKIVLVA